MRLSVIGRWVYCGAIVAGYCWMQMLIGLSMSCSVAFKKCFEHLFYVGGW